MTTGERLPGEARRAGRLQVDALVPVVNAMTQRAIGATRDISMGGLRMEAPEPLVDDALYQLQLELERRDGSRIQVEGGAQVVRQHRRSDGAVMVGMRFIHLDGTCSGRLANWLSDMAQPR